ncbi:hypothetical protein [Phage f2b1]|nr:hypothetical protein [Phage f2b1]
MEWLISIGIVIAGLAVFFGLCMLVAKINGGSFEDDDFWMVVGFIIFVVVATLIVHGVFFEGGK